MFSRMSSKVRTSKKLGRSILRMYDVAFGRTWYIMEESSRKVSFDLVVELNSSPRPDGTKSVWLIVSRMHPYIMGQVRDHVSQNRSNLIFHVGKRTLSADASAILERKAEGMAQASSSYGANSQS